MEPWRTLPEDFGQLLLSALDPAEAGEAAALIAEAAELDDVQLALLLDALAARLRSSPDPVTAAELRALLSAAPPGA